LGAIWCALNAPGRRCWWLAAASAAYGLAVGARPSLLFGAVILLVPAAQAWRDRRQFWRLLLAATGPIALIGLGLMLYNYLRFDNAFEFGVRYQLAAVSLRQFFSWRFPWLNLRYYFLEPVRWKSHFPFVAGITIPPLPPGRAVENTFGALTNTPVIWLALALPLAWRGRSPEARSALRAFLAAVALFFGVCALTMLIYIGACIRYEIEFLSPLVLSAVVGILALDRTLADRLAWRRAARCGWGLLLGFSVAFNLLASVVRCAEAENNLGLALEERGEVKEATKYFNRALQLNPDFAEAHSNLGTALVGLGEPQKALQQFEKSVQLRPDWAPAHYNLGVALEAVGGRMPEAIAQYQKALRVDPGYAEAHDHLANVLARSGKLEDAIAHYQEVLRLKPDDAEAHLNLGAAFAKLGKSEEAIQHYEMALRIQPDYAAAHNSLANAFVRAGKAEEAIAQYQQALQIAPDSVEIHYNLGVALEKAGRVPEAIEHYQQALKLQPDLTAAKNALSRLHAGP
jgi:tetratricopeptide (TPR) repeat protein